MAVEPPPGFDALVPSIYGLRRPSSAHVALSRVDTLELCAPKNGQLGGLDTLPDDVVWSLDCRDRPVHDAALDHVARLTSLEVLRLTRTHVTDAGMHALARMPKLHHLTLNECDITDIGLRTIAVIETLTELELFGTHVTGAGLTALTRHPSLQILDLRHTQVHDGLEPLVTIPKLRQVRLGWWAERHADCLRHERPDVEIL